jgi:hypothetical protein
MEEDTQNKSFIEFSKLIIIITFILFITVLVFSMFQEVSDSTIITCGSIFGVSLAFYYNKAKLENAIKIKIDFYKFKYNFVVEHQLTEEQVNDLNEELDVIEKSIDEKIDNTISDAVNEDITYES